MPKKKGAPDAESKTAQLMRLMARREGATIQEMQEAVTWAAHAVRGVIGSLRARDFEVLAIKEKKRPTIYRLLNAPETLQPEEGSITPPEPRALGAAAGAGDHDPLGARPEAEEPPPEEEESPRLTGTGGWRRGFGALFHPR